MDRTATLTQRSVVAIVVGTRPEAIKVAPLVIAMRQSTVCEPVLISSGQHTEPVSQSLAPFGLTPDHTITLHRTTGSMAELATQVIPPLDDLLGTIAPEAVVVHGDTITAAVGALAAYWRQVPVVHLEAGLRSGDLNSPFPEEGNRLVIDHITSLLLAPTPSAAARLQREGLPDDRIVVTGNTVIDAVQMIAAAEQPFSDPRLEEIAHSGRRVVLLTVHRRESWGEPIRHIVGAARHLVESNPDIQLVVPAHPNPAVRQDVEAGLKGLDRALVCDPLPYPDLARLLSRATLVLSDSGGIQEEAPSFGVPVVVLRDVTERQEAIAAGCASLAGTDPVRIIQLATQLLRTDADTASVARPGNPFGDGEGARRSVEAIAWLLGRGNRPDAFQPTNVTHAAQSA